MGWSIHHPVGLIHHSPAYSQKGYTLLFNNTGNFAALVDMEGRVCHRWEHHGGLAYVKLLPNGNLLGRTRAPADFEKTQGLGGGGSSIVELDWDGVKVWEHEDPWLHHDFHRSLTGETLYLRWEEMPADLSARARGGKRDPEDPVFMLGDAIRQVDADGETVRDWRVWENLSIERQVICPLEGRREWTHANSLNVTKTGDFLVSFRNTSKVIRVSRETGDVTWEWGDDELGHQHNATELDSGNVMIFDNGAHIRQGAASRIIEVNPETNEIEWTYEGSPPMSFFSSYISGADRLPNGNTLICEGAHGRIFEVTPTGQIVWEYISPFFEADRNGSQSNATFRAHRYAPDYPAFAGRDLDPVAHANLNRLLGVM